MKLNARPDARGVVGVGDAMGTVRSVHHLVVSDDRLANPAKQRRLDRIDRGHKLPDPFDVRDQR